MLVLTRRIGEELVICDEIVVQIVDVSGKQVRLGITAPKNISVDRKEIWLRKLNSKKKDIED